MLNDSDNEMDNSSEGSMQRRDQGGVQGQCEAANKEVSDVVAVLINGGGEDDTGAPQGEESEEEDDNTDEAPQETMSGEEAKKLINETTKSQTISIHPTVIGMFIPNSINKKHNSLQANICPSITMMPIQKRL